MPSEDVDAHSGSHHTPVTEVDFAVAADKRRLRRLARELRQRTSAQARRERDTARMRHLMPLVPSNAVVALYLSRPDEPSTLEAAAMLWRRGHRILAPVLSNDAQVLRRHPSWAWYQGPSRLRSGYRGIPEPTGPALPADALSEADVILVSGLAGGRDGSRLGAGAGWFDRALQHARQDAVVVLLLDDEDVCDSVPSTDHDLQVDNIVTESGSFRVPSPTA